MERDVDGGLGCEMLRHERVELGHDGLNVQRIFLQEQRRIVLLDNQPGLCRGLAIAGFVLTCADAAGAIGMNAYEQLFRRLHAPFTRDAQQDDFYFVDKRWHGLLLIHERSCVRAKAFLNRRELKCPELLQWLRASVLSCAYKSRGIYSRRFDESQPQRTCCGELQPKKKFVHEGHEEYEVHNQISEPLRGLRAASW